MISLCDSDISPKIIQEINKTGPPFREEGESQMSVIKDDPRSPIQRPEDSPKEEGEKKVYRIKKYIY